MRKRKLFIIAGLILVGVITGLGFTGFGVYNASQHVPQFYQRALIAEPQVHRQAGEDLAHNVEKLRRHALKEDHWEATFTDSQINGWLASELPRKYPRALPQEMHDPRLAIEEGQAWFGCRYEASSLSVVIALLLQVELDEEPNTIKVRVVKAQAGSLPAPWKKWAEKIAAGAQKANIEMHWEENDGEMLAYLKLPLNHDRLKDDLKHRELLLQKLELRDGALYVAGVSGTPSDVREGGEHYNHVGPLAMLWPSEHSLELMRESLSKNRTSHR